MYSFVSLEGICEMSRRSIQRFASLGRMLAFAAMLCAAPVWAQSAGNASVGADATVPIEQWKAAVMSADPAGLLALYSVNPPMQASTVKGPLDTQAETDFWAGLKAHAINLDVVQRSSFQPGIQVVTFEAEIQRASDTVYVTESQMWQQQSGQWRLVGSKRTDVAHLKQPLNNNKNIYPADADAHVELKEAEERAAKDHKRVLLVFGANWCYDCHVLDLAFHRPDFASAVAGYEIVHVDIGDDGKKNSDLAKQFRVPLEKGVPALAIVESDGKLVVSQKNGEFENARAMTPQALLEFLNHWKPEAR